MSAPLRVTGVTDTAGVVRKRCKAAHFGTLSPDFERGWGAVSEELTLVVEERERVSACVCECVCVDCVLIRTETGDEEITTQKARPSRAAELA